MNSDLKKINKARKNSRSNANGNKSRFVERLIIINRVSKVTKGGKMLSLRAIVVIGDENGKVGVGVYLAWIRAAGGLWGMVLILVAFSISTCVKILSNWWLTYWSHTASSDSASQLQFLVIYCLINVGAIVAEFSQMVVVLLVGLKASGKVSNCFYAWLNFVVRLLICTISEWQLSNSNFFQSTPQLYEALLDCTLAAPMSFYDTTPSGRIMNRFSKGTMSSNDHNLAHSNIALPYSYHTSFFGPLQIFTPWTRTSQVRFKCTSIVSSKF